MIDGAERNDVDSRHERTARKEHQCCECHRTISVGEQYTLETCLYDGHWSTNKTCRHCIAVRSWLSAVRGGWVYEFVREDLEEHRSEGYNPRWIFIAVSGMWKQWKKPDGSLWRVMTLPKHLPVGA